MQTQGPADILYQLVNSQGRPETSLAQIQQQVQAAGMAARIPEHVVAEVLLRFESERALSAAAAPRLLVDWGEVPRVGYQVRPEFSLLCPGYEQSRPEVRVTVDRDLDHDDEPTRRVRVEDPGLWSFQVPFRMTSDGMDCRPGQYIIEVDLSFRDVPAGLPRFYRCRIRLNVRNTDNEDGGVLEIDGDGQSMVNLQGYNLKQFSKVILKGGGDSVINLHDALGSSKESAEPPAEKPTTTFEYSLRIDAEKQVRLPRVESIAERRAFLDACGFFFADGRRTLVMTRPRITFGRSRDNDVIIRFLPRSDENDNYSRSISRTHCIAELTPEGIEIRDESIRGIEVNYRVVQGRELITAAFAGDVIHVELGVTGTVPQKFEMELSLFGPDRRINRDELEYWDELFCEVISGRMSRLQRDALSVGLDAARYDRVTSLPGEETYVHLFREALIGGSPAQSAIVLRESDPHIQARLMHMDRSFWLEPLSGGAKITVDGRTVAPRTLVPLAPGMELKFGNEQVQFDHVSQLYLD